MFEVHGLLRAEFDIDDGDELAFDLDRHVADDDRLFGVVALGNRLRVGADLRELRCRRAAIGAEFRAGNERRLTSRTVHRCSDLREKRVRALYHGANRRVSRADPQNRAEEIGRFVREATGNVDAMSDSHDRRGVSRKGFLVRAGVPSIAAAVGLGTAPPSEAAAAVDAGEPLQGAGPHPVRIALTVNGTRRELSIEPRVTLLDALRESLQLTGTKKGCGQGTCGACTVLVNGRRIDSCLTLAMMHQDDRITTIEGLANGDELHPMQAAFLEHDGFQCGYCTPGQIVSAVGLLAEKRSTDDKSVREYMSGNICRCGAYPNIVAAIQAAAGRT